MNTYALLTATARAGWACAAALCVSAHAADLSAMVGLSTERVVRGLDESDRKPSLFARIDAQHASGLFAGLGVATVSAQQFAGAGVQLSPSVGLRRPLGAAQAAGSWSIALGGTIYPGEVGADLAQRFPALRRITSNAPAALGTGAVNVGLEWRGLSLSLDRTLTRFQGLDGSEGAMYLAGQWRQPIGERSAAWLGAGRQRVPGLGVLDYTDWRVGASTQALGLDWAVEATGSTASGELWRRSADAGAHSDATRPRLTLTTSYRF